MQAKGDIGPADIDGADLEAAGSDATGAFVCPAQVGCDALLHVRAWVIQSGAT